MYSNAFFFLSTKKIMRSVFMYLSGLELKDSSQNIEWCFDNVILHYQRSLDSYVAANGPHEGEGGWFVLVSLQLLRALRRQGMFSYSLLNRSQ